MKIGKYAKEAAVGASLFALTGCASWPSATILRDSQGNARVFHVGEPVGTYTNERTGESGTRLERPNVILTPYGTYSYPYPYTYGPIINGPGYRFRGNIY